MDKYFLIIIPILLFGASCYPQLEEDRLSVTIPNIEQEASSIWRTINDIEFFGK